MRWVSKHDESDSEDECEETTEGVRVAGTDIFYYGDITTEAVLELNTKLKKLERSLLKKAVDLPGYQPQVTIHINSGGGDIFAGLSAMDHVASCRVKVVTVADGLCASAATFLLMGGHRRMIHSSAYVLIHQLSSGFWGKYEEMKDELKSCEKFMSVIREVYERKANIPQKKLDNMMKRDIYLTSKECLKYEIVDELFSGGPGTS